MRQEEVEDPEGFDEILAIYVNERDTYAHYMEKLGTISEDIEAIGEQVEEELIPEEEFVEEEPVDEAASEEVVDITEELQFFEDDDLDFGDDEEDLEALDDEPIENE